MLFQRVVRWCRSAAGGGGRWWIVFLVSGALGSLVLAQPPCQTPGCSESWRGPIWIPPNPDSGVGLEGPWYRLYPDCQIRVKVWARCCNGVLQLYIGEVEVKGDSCTLARDIREGRRSASDFMDEVTIAVVVNQQMLAEADDTLRNCATGVKHCNEGGNYYYEVFRVSCFGWEDTLISSNKQEGGISHIRPGPRWVPCGSLCCSDRWIICLTDPPCVSENRNPCLNATVVQRGVTTERCPLFTGRIRDCRSVCRSGYGQSRDDGSTFYTVASKPVEESVVRVYNVLGAVVAEYRCSGGCEAKKEWLRQNLARGVYILVHWIPAGPRVEYVRVP